MTCDNCGSTINKKDKFCNNCGSKIIKKNKFLVFSIISLIFSLIAKFVSFGFNDMFELTTSFSPESAGGGAIAIVFIVIIVIILAIIILAMTIISVIFLIIVIMFLIKINNKTKKEYASLLFSCISLILIVSIFIGLF